ncbi:MAG: phosphomannomutase/phosphoglucomutase [Bacilli bacterium]|nr:phosphomannomutase/phosphoglucomutase [Bacilli bacterium]
MELNKYMFREYDIRGVYGKDINEEISYLIGKAFATKLIEQGSTKTLVGHDNRHSSPIISKNLIMGITECGVDVVDLGLVTTPMYYYGWDLLNVKCGIMITASHNPKDDNGFKFSYNGIYNASGSATVELYDIIVNNNFKKLDKIGTVTEADIKDDYINMIINSTIMGDRRIKVVYDCGNGTTSIVADDIFDRFRDRLDLIPLFNDSNADFPNHHPDPAVEANLELLKAKVLETKADIGVAYDGDGDRVGVIDDKGRFIDIDKVMVVIWKSLVKENVEKKTFYDVKCSLALKEELDKLGVANEFYRTGNSYTKAKSYEGNYPFGGELSGHVFFRDRFNGYDDGIYASLRIIEILTKDNNSMSSMIDSIVKYYSTPEIKIATPDEIKFTVIDKIKEYATSKNYNILTIDGVKVFFDDGSALVRASNTGPNITCRFESKDENRLKLIQDEFLKLIDKYKEECL